MFGIRYYLFDVAMLGCSVIAVAIAFFLAYRRPTKFYQPLITLAQVIGILAILSVIVSNGAAAMIRMMITSSVALLITAILFQKIEQRYTHSWIRIVFHLVLAVGLLQGLTMQSYATLPATVAVIVCNCLGCAGLTYLVAHLLYNKHKRHSPAPSKMDHYYQAGLSKQEIDFFREQMAEAKTLIEQIEYAFQQTAKLRAIEVRHNTVKVCQNFFKEIVQQPTKLSHASTFLYKLLPSLSDLLGKYNEINGHIAKNKQTYLILEKSAATIEQLCDQINESYIQFHQDDYNGLMDEIQLANRNLKKPTDNTTIDDLLSNGGIDHD